MLNEPIIVQHGLERAFFRFSPVSTRQERYVALFRSLCGDLLSHPLLAIKAWHYIQANYVSPKYGIVDYLDVRHFFGTSIDLIHSPFSIPSIIDKVMLLSYILKIPYTLSFKAHDIWQGKNFWKRPQKLKGLEMLRRSLRLRNSIKYFWSHILNQIKKLK